MSAHYHILMRTATAIEIVAEITEDGTVTGPDAEHTRQMLQRYGYPGLPLEEAIERYVFTCSTYYGWERVSSDDDQAAPPQPPV